MASKVTFTAAPTPELLHQSKKRMSCIAGASLDPCRQCNMRTTADCVSCRGSMFVRKSCEGCVLCRSRPRADSGVVFDGASSSSSSSSSSAGR